MLDGLKKPRCRPWPTSWGSRGRHQRARLVGLEAQAAIARMGGGDDVVPAAHGILEAAGAGMLVGVVFGVHQCLDIAAIAGPGRRDPALVAELARVGAALRLERDRAALADRGEVAADQRAAAVMAGEGDDLALVVAEGTQGRVRQVPFLAALARPGDDRLLLRVGSDLQPIADPFGPRRLLREAGDRSCDCQQRRWQPGEGGAGAPHATFLSGSGAGAAGEAAAAGFTILWSILFSLRKALIAP